MSELETAMLGIIWIHAAIATFAVVMSRRAAIFALHGFRRLAGIDPFRGGDVKFTIDNGHADRQ